MSRPTRRWLPTTALALIAIAALGCKGNDAPARKAPPTPAADPWAAAQPPKTGTAPATPPPTPTAAPMLRKPFFYEIERAGKLSYLLGTMHLGVDAEKQLPTGVWARLDAAKTFAMEADLSGAGVMASLMRSDGTTLEAELGPDDWAKLIAAAPDLGPGMKNMKASVAATVLSVQGLPMTPAMDLVFATKAKQAGKPIVFLEEAALQIKILDKWMDVRALRGMLSDMTATRAAIAQTLAAYQAGDGDAMIAKVADAEAFKRGGRTDQEFTQAMEELLYARNRAWIPVLEPLLTEGGAFIAVGAGHLVGPGSVVELLTAKGYRVTRIEQAP